MQPLEKKKASPPPPPRSTRHDGNNRPRMFLSSTTPRTLLSSLGSLGMHALPCASTKTLSHHRLIFSFLFFPSFLSPASRFTQSIQVAPPREPQPGVVHLVGATSLQGRKGSHPRRSSSSSFLVPGSQALFFFPHPILIIPSFGDSLGQNGEMPALRTLPLLNNLSLQPASRSLSQVPSYPGTINAGS
jgi:hypothetical protein